MSNYEDTPSFYEDEPEGEVELVELISAFNPTASAKSMTSKKIRIIHKRSFIARHRAANEMH